MKTLEITLTPADAHALLTQATRKINDRDPEPEAQFLAEGAQANLRLRLFLNGDETTHVVELVADGTWRLRTYIGV